jgi:hypothetical protein
MCHTRLAMVDLRDVSRSLRMSYPLACHCCASSVREPGDITF